MSPVGNFANFDFNKIKKIGKGDALIFKIY